MGDTKPYRLCKAFLVPPRPEEQPSGYSSMRKARRELYHQKFFAMLTDGLHWELQDSEEKTLLSGEVAQAAGTMPAGQLSKLIDMPVDNPRALCARMNHTLKQMRQQIIDQAVADLKQGWWSDPDMAWVLKLSESHPISKAVMKGISDDG